ncbi:YfiR family protein [Vibrio methylphosphonaticus]|uniref:YfiR family protein n=1 Tax=Vibrio methylphosphonaticus TaxID=2946866 RepID=UPI002029F860|nr:YfiR family protein [Vibrio methylphosphonaticus]MCL9776241.1 YfiR family protein [Vibrio methylphosphonaticus]
MLRTRWLRRMFIMFGLFCYSLPVSSQYSDDDLKSVYLFRFAMLAEWPKSVSVSAKEYCVARGSQVGDGLKKIVEAKLGEQAFYGSETLSLASTCHILYVESGSAALVSRLKSQFPHALLIGNGMQFIDLGGMIAFIRVNNRIKPLIAPAHAQQSGVKIRSQLLKVAEIVEVSL